MANTLSWSVYDSIEDVQRLKVSIFKWGICESKNHMRDIIEECDKILVLYSPVRNILGYACCNIIISENLVDIDLFCTSRDNRAFMMKICKEFVIAHELRGMRLDIEDSTIKGLHFFEHEGFVDSGYGYMVWTSPREDLPLMPILRCRKFSYSEGPCKRNAVFEHLCSFHWMKHYRFRTTMEEEVPVMTMREAMREASEEEAVDSR